MSRLPMKLRVAAQIFSSTMKKTGGQYILVGGGASISLGCQRETKDLDFNIYKLTTRMIRALEANGIMTRPLEFPNRFSAHVPESSPGKHDATSMDLAVKPDIPSLLLFTKVIDGITVADERLLLVDKIRCFTERSDNQDKKLQSDLQDILFCLGQIEDEEGFVPELLKARLEKEDIWPRFWSKLEARTDSGDFEIFKDFLESVGLPWCELLSRKRCYSLTVYV